MMSAAVGPSVVSTSQPRADSASCRPMATRAWSSTMSTRPVMAPGAGTQHERGATAGTGADGDRAALLGHQPAGDVQAEPGSGALVAATPRSNTRPARRTGDPAPRSSTYSTVDRIVGALRPASRPATTGRAGGRCPAGPPRPAPCCRRPPSTSTPGGTEDGTSSPDALAQATTGPIASPRSNVLGAPTDHRAGPAPGGSRRPARPSARRPALGSTVSVPAQPRADASIPNRRRATRGRARPNGPERRPARTDRRRPRHRPRGPNPTARRTLPPLSYPLVTKVKVAAATSIPTRDTPVTYRDLVPGPSSRDLGPESTSATGTRHVAAPAFYKCRPC